MRPGWVHPCECGHAELGAYCAECGGFSGGYAGETWQRPQASAPKGRAEAPDSLAPLPTSVVEAMPRELDGRVLCKNGRYARPAREGERLLPCGCPMAGAPRECIDAVAVKTVEVKPQVGTGH